MLSLYIFMLVLVGGLLLNLSAWPSCISENIDLIKLKRIILNLDSSEEAVPLFKLGCCKNQIYY